MYIKGHPGHMTLEMTSVNGVQISSGVFVCVTCATIDRMPTTPIKTAMVVEEKLMTWRNIQK